MAAGHPLLNIEQPVAVPLLHGINATDPAGIERELESALAAGYGTLKIKAGFDLEADLARVSLIQALQPRARKAACRCQSGLLQGRGLRVRAPDIARLRATARAALPRRGLGRRAAVAEVTPVPMMLDESIYDIEDIERAASLGARASSSSSS